MCETPPRSPTMVGIAVETIVWSSAAMSMPASRAEKIRLIRRRVRTIGGAADISAGGACTECSIGRTSVPRVRGTGSAGWYGEPGGQGVPRLGDQIGQRGGEVGGQPAVQRAAHRRGGDAGQQ